MTDEEIEQAKVTEVCVDAAFKKRIEDFRNDLKPVFFEREVGKLMPEMMKLGLAWKEGDVFLRGKEGDDWLRKKFRVWLKTIFQLNPDFLRDAFADVCCDTWDTLTEEGIANGDMERLPNGNIRLTKQGRAKYEAEKSQVEQKTPHHN